MQEHPRRRDLIDELHARPFAEVSAPCDVVFLACKHPENAVGRDRAGERDRLTDRLSAAGLDPNKVGTNHFLDRVAAGDRHALAVDRFGRAFVLGKPHGAGWSPPAST